jgi:hypothetical protein
VVFVGVLLFCNLIAVPDLKGLEPWHACRLIFKPLPVTSAIVARGLVAILNRD